MKSWWPAVESETRSAISSVLVGLGGSGVWSAESRRGSGILVSNGWSQNCVEGRRRSRLKRRVFGEERVVLSRKRSPALFKWIVIRDIIATFLLKKALSDFTGWAGTHERLLWQQGSWGTFVSDRVFHYKWSTYNCSILWNNNKDS